MSEIKKNTKQSVEEIMPFLEYLQENKAKLEILLSGEQGLKPLTYPIKGKRTTKTVFIAENLQKLMTEYCSTNDIKMGEFVELAVIQYLIQNGFEDKIQPLLTSIVISEN